MIPRYRFVGNRKVTPDTCPFPKLNFLVQMKISKKTVTRYQTSMPISPCMQLALNITHYSSFIYTFALEIAHAHLISHSTKLACLE